MGKTLSVPFIKYSGDQIEKNEMGGTCSTMEERRSIQGFGGKT
jgi:hypothetical protein